MTSDKVGRVQPHFNSLNHKLPSRLTERMTPQTPIEPNTSPPSSVGFVMLELSGQEDGNEDLEDTPLNGNHGDKTEDGVRGVPEF